MADSSKTRILGRLVVSSFCILVVGCRVWFLVRRPSCTLDSRRLGLRKIGRLLALPASRVFPLRLHVSASKVGPRRCFLTDVHQPSKISVGILPRLAKQAVFQNYCQNCNRRTPTQIWAQIIHVFLCVFFFLIPRSRKTHLISVNSMFIMLSKDRVSFRK